MGGQVSREGDVYSYGILLLEMFTGKRTTDNIFAEGLNLHTFVANALPESFLQIVDPNVVPSASMTREEETHNDNGEVSSENQGQMNGNYGQSCLLSVLRIAVGCSMESPGDRLKMEVVTRQLHRTKKALLVGLQSASETEVLTMLDAIQVELNQSFAPLPQAQQDHDGIVPLPHPTEVQKVSRFMSGLKDSIRNELAMNIIWMMSEAINYAKKAENKLAWLYSKTNSSRRAYSAPLNDKPQYSRNTQTIPKPK
ncbi:hypothetical protein FNV43_RR05770 [Rhamnella rubrinervis]|uniref:Uncharacterized protein n=1 Tax=Rhamnella rubrinervis TaxID=2594499 RepID=A0A8K0HM67_9ROSA|nr:hypothetical protein FNV43_RR05770 [Rhamnella rubrinervis]